MGPNLKLYATVQGIYRRWTTLTSLSFLYILSTQVSRIIVPRPKKIVSHYMYSYSLKVTIKFPSQLPITF